MSTMEIAHAAKYRTMLDRLPKAPSEEVAEMVADARRFIAAPTLRNWGRLDERTPDVVDGPHRRAAAIILDEAEEMVETFLATL